GEAEESLAPTQHPNDAGCRREDRCPEAQMQRDPSLHEEIFMAFSLTVVPPEEILVILRLR
ncbi:MAG: hypothetical protein C4291_14955, partial [Candidatus Dadabacteria bacterium]